MELRNEMVQIGSHRIFYRLAGSGSETVVLMHGIPTNSMLWSTVIPQLASSYTVIAPDLLGFGQSGRATAQELTLPKQAERMIALLDQLGVRKAHFVGHDLGGGIAQIIAVRYPERVASFVVADGVCFSNWPLPHVVSLRAPIAPEFEPSPIFIERMIRGGLYHQESISPELIHAFVAPFDHPSGPEQLQSASFALEHHQTEELVPYLSKLNVPATFLWGQHDRYLPPYWGMRLQQTVPNSQLRIIPQANHYSMLDNPGVFAGELLQHLQRASTMQRTPVLV
ncbi:alpha/beta fold hydrolase [Paenibacillus turpanensis]|uniref:alpha/beta fold hydrolase n=1 Tax=Paenibacillus turpanensis TaxID=2689078 RepID=UPI0014099E32|nr:alpha/beta hydrolase [Paenibacillus turpanensis]